MDKDKEEAHQEGFKEGLKQAVDIISDGRTHCILHDKQECATCLANLSTELNTLDKPPQVT